MIIVLDFTKLQTKVGKDFTITVKAPSRTSLMTFQPGEGPSRGLLRDYRTSIFAKVRLI